jgi:hypothetical protein
VLRDSGSGIPLTTRGKRGRSRASRDPKIPHSDVRDFVGLKSHSRTTVRFLPQSGAFSPAVGRVFSRTTVRFLPQSGAFSPAVGRVFSSSRRARFSPELNLFLSNVNLDQVPLFRTHVDRV